MRWLAWFLEDKPGPVGKLQVDAPEPEDQRPPKKWMVWATILLGIGCWEVGLLWVVAQWPWLRVSQGLLKVGSLSLYVWISYRLSARPDLSNLGWWGGLLDNPFRSSDNVNRWLLYLQLLLVPGKLMAYSFVMGWIIFNHMIKKTHQ
ncbi:hypothetical protein [Spirosoma linguale]|uniref:Uncharacterized protein n=1 Tax=Spirosoma linguale (strain ATCC 33905 / DSM 74 / LMG 10896 / Claus 1) TaxID=504472 RepID=D2QDI9_SPILD|nr:hypothetical protein Slin_2080 [Spirosoma linguale DSM 74]